MKQYGGEQALKVTKTIGTAYVDRQWGEHCVDSIIPTGEIQ